MSQWSEATQERAREIMTRYPQKRSAVMPLLYLAMAEEGHLSDEGMEEVGRWVGITPAQVQAVATFYTMYKRKPTGKYLISCCTSISCMLLGGDDVLLGDCFAFAEGQVGMHAAGSVVVHPLALEFRRFEIVIEKSLKGERRSAFASRGNEKAAAPCSTTGYQGRDNQQHDKTNTAADFSVHGMFLDLIVPLRKSNACAPLHCCGHRLSTMLPKQLAGVWTG